MAVSQRLTQEQSTALKDALSDPYRGTAVDAFLNYLERNDKAFHTTQPKYYAKFCSIVQSSGTGKTRLMLELSRKGVCVLYMNIRSPSDDQGYPPRDDIPADILTRYCDTEDKYHMQCCVFFAAVFKVLRMFLEEKHDWYEDMCQIGSLTRTAFFESLEKEFANVEKEVRSSSEISTLKKYYVEMATSRCLPGPRAKGNNPRVVIALDEAHSLHERRYSGPFLRATVLLRTIKEYSEFKRHAVWVVFASTTSKLAHFASPQALFPSARVAVEGQLLFPPFTQLGWDQHAPSLQAVQLDEVATEDHILQYGRPLWVSLKRGFSLPQILLLAQEKLCGAEAFNPHSHHQTFAVLAQRFCLDITFGHRNAVHYIETLVASHLRVCIKTTEDRIWSYTTYPSEPILSSAAAHLLHMNDKLVPALRTLAGIISDGVVNIGQIGELVSRLLWLLAKDFFIRTRVNDSAIVEDANEMFDYELQDCQPVPVVEYLKFVFGSQVWETTPDAQELFQNAYINFSHWVSMDFNITRGLHSQEHLSIDEWTRSHWTRTSAIQCCHGQPLIDKVIPLYFKTQGSINRMEVSHILISDKARNRSQYSSLNDIQRDHASIAPGYRGLPYIAILVDLGVEKSTFKATLDPYEENKDMCLRIYASGLNANTYPFLQGQAELTDILKRHTVPSGPTFLENLEDQVRFGRSREIRYMNYKKGQ